ncbi:MAG: regulatory protein RecX, partial [Chloroflexota bacterium]
MADAARRPPDRVARRDAARARRAEVTDVAVVLAAAGDILAGRPVTVAWMRTRLTRLGYPAPLVETAIERLIAVRYLDDRAFADAWLASRDRSRPRGARALRTELLRAGVPDPVVREVLAT